MKKGWLIGLFIGLSLGYLTNGLGWLLQKYNWPFLYYLLAPVAVLSVLFCGLGPVGGNAFGCNVILPNLIVYLPALMGLIIGLIFDLTWRSVKED
ncbi:MAG: hypothetical protein KC506_00460 [Nanoarchaeota archaeon]|nr:hypothetical protein [Nanoarchaeota archaeon]